MIAITSVVTVALLLSRPAHKEITPVPNVQHETIAPVVEQPLILQTDSPKKEKAKVPGPGKNKTAVSFSSASSDSTQSAASRNTSVSAEVTTDNDSVSATVVVNNRTEAGSKEHVWTATSKKCKCTFGSDDDWIEDVVKELLKEKLIESECDYKFKLTAHAFYVDGKEIDDKQFASKMLKLFEASTGERLHNDDDYVSVKMNGKSCSLSKNINN